MGTIRHLHDTTAARLCEPDHWRLEPVYGEEPGWLACLLCREGHIHHAIRRVTLVEARREMGRFQREVFGRRLPVEDVASGRRILPR